MATRKRNSPRVRVVAYKDRPFGIRWRGADGRMREESTGATRRRDAEKIAAQKEIDLAAEIASPISCVAKFRAWFEVELSSQLCPTSMELWARAADLLEREVRIYCTAEPTSLSWPSFRKRYETEALPYLSKASSVTWKTAANWLEREVGPKTIADVDRSALAKLQSSLSKAGRAPTTIGTHLGTIRAALGWAYDLELIDKLPRVRKPRGASRKMRSRPVTPAEFEAILETVPAVRTRDAADWRHFLLGLWHSGLRVDELRRLTWHKGAELSICTEHAIPLIRMLADGHKSRRDAFQPITPEFWELIKDRRRKGNVFPLCGVAGQMTAKSVVKAIAKIGAAAGVVTDETTGKTATSHDIGRRAFITRMDAVLNQSELQKWARHASPETTMTFYHHKTALELAAKVWSEKALQSVAQTA